jgi:hypothetical protein
MNLKTVLVSPFSLYLPYIIPLVDDAMPIMEGSLFPFFPNNFSSFVDITVPLTFKYFPYVLIYSMI